MISFRTKLAVGFIGVLILISALLIRVFYDRAHYVERDNLRHRLIGIAATGALMIDGDKHDLLRSPGDSARPEFRELRSVLTHIKRSNDKITYIYTMRKTADPRTFEFVIDEAEEEDENGNGIIDPEEATAPIGEKYDAGTYPALQAAYTGPGADRILQSDQWGTWLSGYAPIFNRLMEPVGILGIDMDARDVLALERRLKIHAYLVLGAAVLASVVAGVLLARHFSTPIRKLLSGIQQVAAGNLEARININRKDEIGLLGEAFNNMAKNLGESRKELDESNRLLEEKVTERTRELEKARDAMILSEKIAAVGSLAGGVAHEFNNIFAAVRAYAELALDTDDPKLKTKAFKVAISLSDRAKTITSALQAYSREGGSLEKERINLAEILDRCLSLFKNDLNTSKITVVKEYGNIPEITGDGDQLQHAFGNLIANAREAMAASGGTLSIEVATQDGTVSVSFSDTGGGISPYLVPRLFEPFQGEKGVMACGQSCYIGLGLFAALGIIRGHGGTIEVDNRPGSGATFTVILPLPGKAPAGEKPARKPALPAAAPSPARLLIADDERALASLLEQYLSKRGFEVETAGTGREAVEKAKVGDYDLIFMDIAMPDLDGETAMQEILEFRPSERFVVISGFSDRVFPPELQPSIVEYLQKPFRLSQASEVVFRALETSP